MLPLSTHQCPTCSCHPSGCPCPPLWCWLGRLWLGRAHAPCEEHAGIHDSSTQHGHRGVLCLQLILPHPREADSEVLPLVQHCREVEVRRVCIVAGTAGGGQGHPPLSGGRLDSAEKVRYIT